MEPGPTADRLRHALKDDNDPVPAFQAASPASPERTLVNVDANVSQPNMRRGSWTRSACKSLFGPSGDLISA